MTKEEVIAEDRPYDLQIGDLVEIRDGDGALMATGQIDGEHPMGDETFFDVQIEPGYRLEREPGHRLERLSETQE